MLGFELAGIILCFERLDQRASLSDHWQHRLVDKRAMVMFMSVGKGLLFHGGQRFVDGVISGNHLNLLLFLIIVAFWTLLGYLFLRLGAIHLLFRV